jgi:hypothetical protein
MNRPPAGRARMSRAHLRAFDVDEQASPESRARMSTAHLRALKRRLRHTERVLVALGESD